MNGPSHHPSDATLIAYAAGGLDEGLALVTATHLHFCAACRRKIAETEVIGGVLLEDLIPVPLAETAFEKTLARLKDQRPPQPQTPRGALPSGLGDVPEPLRSRLIREGAPSWRLLGPGVRRAAVPGSAATTSSVHLLRIDPGARLPLHGHEGTELALVLRGAFRHEGGEFRRGDVDEADPETRHRPRVIGREPCICLVAADAPLRFSGLARLIQPFIGM